MKTEKYLKIYKEDIFGKDMQEMKFFGYKIFGIYFRLCALSLENMGSIMIKNNSDDNYLKQLGNYLEEDGEEIEIVLLYLKKRGLVEINEGIDSVLINIPYVKDNIEE